MKAILFALAATAGYAITNYIYEKSFSKVSAVVMTSYLSVVCMACGMMVLCTLKLGGKTLVFPESSQLWLMALLGVAALIIELFYFGAYNAGGSATVITTVLMFIPVFTEMLKFFCEKKHPSWIMLLAWALASASIIVMSFDEKPKQESSQAVTVDKTD